MDKFTVRILREAAKSLGLKCVIEPRFNHVGYIESAEGKRMFFKLSALDANPLAASRIATDKDYTHFFLNRFGYPTIPTEAFYSDEWCVVNGTVNNLEAAVKYANASGYPKIVKPNSKSQGRGVAKVFSERELRDALAEIFRIDNIALIQPFVTGNDYRIVVYKNEVFAAYSRSPLTVTGDGKGIVRSLMPECNISLNAVSARLAREYGMTLDTVPAAGTTLQLLDNANLSTGGKAVDVTGDIHDSTKELAVRVTKDLGLNLAGIDILTTDDIGEPMLKYVIIEVNAMPGLEHFASLGPEQMAKTKRLYESILKDGLL